MSGLWNPYAFSPTGEAVPVGAPPALRIMNGQATSAQLTTAQTVFANFCMHARLSTVPNATEQGRFPDGSTYRIVTIGGSMVMELYPATTGTQTKNVFSGILMEFGTGKEPVVLVNEGETDAPGSHWRIEKPPKNNPSPTGGTGAAAGYNQWAWMEVACILGGKAKYAYPTPNFYQYGRLVGYASPEVFIPTGADEDGRILAVARIGGAIHTARTMEKATDTNWYGLDDLPTQLPLRFFADGGPIFTATEGELISSVTPSRSGRKISFIVSKYDYFTPADLPPDKVLTLERAVPFFARAAVDSSSGIVFITNAAPGLGEGERTHMIRGFQIDVRTSTREAGTFLPATVEWEFPDDVIDPPQESLGVVDIAMGRVYFFSPEKTSLRITGLVRPVYDSDGNGGGSFGYRSTRSEDTHTLLGLNYVGHEQLARVVSARKFRHEQEQRGYRNSQRASNGTGTRSTSSTTTTSTEVEECVDLPWGRMYLCRDIYRATSTLSVSERWTIEEYPEGLSSTEESTLQTSMSYTLSREKRYLYVYDPALDFACYSEAVFDVTWSGSGETYAKGRRSGGYPLDSTRYSLSPGPDFPDGVPLQFVLKHRVLDIRVAVPQSYVDGLSSTERKLFYASFFPNSGVAPTTPPDTAPRTVTGFAHHPVDVLQGVSTEGPDYVSSEAIYIPGMCPEIRPPGNIRVLYRKTPETGGGFLDISSEDRKFSRRFLIDSSGVRDADSVVPGLPPTPWSNVRTF